MPDYRTDPHDDPTGTRDEIDRLRERVAELEGLIREAVSTVETSMPSEMRDTMLNEWVPRARRALDKGEDDG